MSLSRAERIIKLRNALKAELSRRKQTSITYTDAELLGIPMKAVHLQEIRDKVDTIKTKAYTDNPLIPNQSVAKEVHVSELENMVSTLASAPLNGGTTTCNAGCTGVCVSCTGTCQGSCTSCSGCSGCSGACSFNCTGNCKNSCYGGCSGSCSDGCYSSCKSGCSSCVGSCVHICAILSST